MNITFSPQQQATITLWYLVNMSLSSFAKLTEYFGNAQNAINAKLGDWQSLNLHKSHIERFEEFINQGRNSPFLQTTLQQIANGEYGVIFADDSQFPPLLKEIYDPPPLLFYQGNIQALSMPQLAVVGSRKLTAHASKIAFDMAQFLAYEGLWITSGLADGVDKQAHVGALAQNDPNKQGRTVAVLGTGIRLCYPKNHLALKNQIIQTGGCVISELLPDSPPNNHNFPRRNRLVAGLSLATLVVEAQLQSGSLITARLTNEQGKQVFAIPSHIDNVNAKGCHQLIREGATLIDHPAQILEDLAMFKSPFSQHANLQNPISQNNVSQNTDLPNTENLSNSLENTIINNIEPIQPTQTNNDIPPHLFSLLNQLDWAGQDLDSLVEKTGLDIATLSGQLIELEIMGLAMAQGGLYLRCRA
ncbi:DNA-processing protein DprA [Faucicola mancuniensis]|uniref:DNA-processing protein DprA n=1 Tax=Faucicola mancuniensis TaxID=1309795 RepID=UPI0028EE4192|nr:DNA-processing protein DprA [uncultured Moraxella sp.]